MAAAALLKVQPAVVVLDLDGTTLDADHKLAPATAAALRRANKAVRLIFATGRPTWDVQPFVDALGAPVTCVLFNGASCATLRPHTAPATRFLEPLGGERAAEAYRIAQTCGGAVSLVLPTRSVGVATNAKQRAQLAVLDRKAGSAQEIVEDGAPYVCEAIKVLALSDDPAAPPDAVATLHAAAADRSAYVDDIYASIVALEKAKKADRRVSGDELNGKWRLVYTSGTKKVAANLNRAGFGGSYFPVRAVQSFDVGAGRIRNGIYLGPLKFFFDGPFVWRERLSMLEFTFTKVSLAVGPFGPVSFDIDDGKWDAVKMAEQSASDGQGKVEKGNASKPGANPFFKFVHTDEKCIAARGRVGRLALWSK